jgi:hypothetical protein
MLGSLAAKKHLHRSDPTEETEIGCQNILVHGDVGSGKTWSARTLEPFAPILFFNFDRRRLTTFQGLPKGSVTELQFGNSLDDPNAYAAADAALVEASKEEWGCVVIDTLTTLGLAAMSSVLDIAGRAGQTPQQNDYLPQMNRIEHFLFGVTALPKVKHFRIVTAHDERAKDEITGGFIQSIAVTGKLSTRIFRFFDEVYFATREGEGEKAKWKWVTRQNRSTVARTQILGLPEKIDQDYSILKEKHNV